MHFTNNEYKDLTLNDFMASIILKDCMLCNVTFSKTDISLIEASKMGTIITHCYNVARGALKPEVQEI